MLIPIILWCTLILLEFFFFFSGHNLTDIELNNVKIDKEISGLIYCKNGLNMVSYVIILIVLIYLNLYTY